MTPKELEQVAKSTKSARMRNRYLAFSQFVDEGINGLSEGRHSGRPIKLTAPQLEQLSHFIQDNSTPAKGGRLQAKDIQYYIADNYQVEYEISNIYRLLHHLNFSLITSRSRHPKQDEGVQTLFKKLLTGNDP